MPISHYIAVRSSSTYTTQKSTVSFKCYFLFASIILLFVEEQKIMSCVHFVVQENPMIKILGTICVQTTVFEKFVDMLITGIPLQFFFLSLLTTDITQCIIKIPHSMHFSRNPPGKSPSGKHSCLGSKIVDISVNV